MRYVPFALALMGIAASGALLGHHGAWPALILSICVLLVAIGLWDMLQTNHSLRRNYPILANLRFLLEKIRPEIRQYFLESDLDGAPFNRSNRAIVYQRSKGQLDKRPFGTQLDVYGEGYEWLTHSMAPRHLAQHDFRTVVGGAQCLQPYSLSVFNISAMSFGALSANAIRALNKGAKLGGFAHDTGEGSFSIHHREFGGDIIWEIGSGYFGCRNSDGTFAAEKFRQQAAEPQIKMIEIKLSQGAKPGHGGVLPGAKVTPEIAAARGVAAGEDCISPARHSAFATPLEMMAFIEQLRTLSGGKPIGFKLCIGHRSEFMALIKAMHETDIVPDFIVIDGKEGGTGAAPLEFTDHLGTPLREGLVFVHNCLVGARLRDRVKLGASGRIITAFDMMRAFALGADWCNSARGFMFALGCVQSLSCHTDRCPTGVATQDPLRQRAIVVPAKAERAARFHESTLKALAELLGAAGLECPRDAHRGLIMHRRPPHEGRSFAEIYPELDSGSLLTGLAEASYLHAWSLARADSFAPSA
ncbi:MAG: FMN-binding glutamate synthase family protein [Steroidobacteraceae bacterium]|jgi:glutamate synthase domain-containing protein 2